MPRATRRRTPGMRRSRRRMIGGDPCADGFLRFMDYIINYKDTQTPPHTLLTVFLKNPFQSIATVPILSTRMKKAMGTLGCGHPELQIKNGLEFWIKETDAEYAARIAKAGFDATAIPKFMDALMMTDLNTNNIEEYRVLFDIIYSIGKPGSVQALYFTYDAAWTQTLATQTLPMLKQRRLFGKKETRLFDCLTEDQKDYIRAAAQGMRRVVQKQ